MTKINLILPKTRVDVRNKKVFFLAGPIRGGGNWQVQAIRMIAERLPDVFIACPCRWDYNHPLFKYAVADDPDVREPFPRQKIWERYYLNIASRQGCIIFWLPEESKTDPRPPETGPYGRDTYGEVGEWRAALKYRQEKVRMVFGGERGFSGLELILLDFQDLIGPGFVSYDTLKDAIVAGVKVAQ